MNDTKEREAFEKWLEDNSTYKDGERDCWEFWQQAFQAGRNYEATQRGSEQVDACISPMELIKLLGYVNAMVGYCQSLRVGTVVTDGYMKRMDAHYIPNVQKAALFIAELLDKYQAKPLLTTTTTEGE